MQTFKTYELDLDALARFDRPVYFALGGLSNPDQFGAIATRLSRVFRTSSSRYSTSDTTSIRRIGSNPSGSHTHSEHSGFAPIGQSRRRNAETGSRRKNDLGSGASLAAQIQLSLQFVSH